MKMKANYHTHTTFCDGHSTPEEMVRRAVELGFAHLGFSGHIDINPVMDVDAYIREIRRLEETYRDSIEILCGGELDNMYPRRHIEGVDYVIGSTHHLDVSYERPLALDNTEEEVLFLLNEFYGGDAFHMARDYFRIVAHTYDDTHCAFIGHFDLLTRYNQSLGFLDEADPRYLAPALEAMEYLVSEGVPLEINTRQSHWGKLYPSPLLLRKLHELGGEIVINSDAHIAAELDKGFSLAVETARACGFDHTNLLTRQNGRVVFLQEGLS